MTHQRQYLWALIPTISLLLAAAPALSTDRDHPIGEISDQNIFVKMCDASPDGKVSKEQVMRTVDRMFDKHDTRKEGKLDRKQVEYFLMALTAPSGA
jgi:hypothetical protein